jgi:elongation factor G
MSDFIGIGFWHDHGHNHEHHYERNRTIRRLGFMKDYGTEKLRNVVLLGHGSAGKTSLAEAMLFTSGAVNRMGEVEKGTTVADFDEEEIGRHISLNLALVPVEWKDTKINVLDTPGYTDFVGEVKSSIRVADLALIVVDAVSGVEVGTELAWDFVEEQGLPRMVVVNKMNRENASLDRTLESLREAFGQNFVPMCLPIGAEGDFAGVIDLVRMKAVMGSEGKT